MRLVGRNGGHIDYRSGLIPLRLALRLVRLASNTTYGTEYEGRIYLCTIARHIAHPRLRQRSVTYQVKRLQ